MVVPTTTLGLSLFWQATKVNFGRGFYCDVYAYRLKNEKRELADHSIAFTACFLLFDPSRDSSTSPTFRAVEFDVKIAPQFGLFGFLPSSLWGVQRIYGPQILHRADADSSPSFPGVSHLRAIPTA
jgi:hypothetical protein